MKAAVLKILILGGTNFLGPHLVEELEQRGHEITLFNRGTQDMSRFPQVETAIVGDVFWQGKQVLKKLLFFLLYE